jgi:hypothetical protein
MTEMTTQERARYDAQAEHEAWTYARELMEPMMELVRAIGHDELTQVMEKPHAEVELWVGLTLDVLEDYQEGAEPGGAYRAVLERLATSHGFSGAEEVARLAAERDPGYTAEGLLTSPSGGYGPALDAVLNMTEAERVRLSRGFARTFMTLDGTFMTLDSPFMTLDSPERLKEGPNS